MSEDGVLELRQYTLRAGQRDTLISIFERNFIESQNALGAHVIGSFRDLDDPDRFVWIRGFADMQARQMALEAFYGGPVWREHAKEANATMIDSGNVLLLRPAAPGQGFSHLDAPNGGSGAIIGATIHYLGAVDAAQFATFFQNTIAPKLTAAGVQPIACLVTEESANNFPRLPVRDGERTFIWFAHWRSVAEHAAFLSRFSALSGWRDAAPEAILPALMQKPERLRLAPTQRSALR
jgi:quinol monooxygenase YgiN